MTLLTTQFEKAVAYAAQLHKNQVRKGTTIPYLAHLIGTASIALEHGANEDQAIAALLHDAVEDQSHGGTTAEEIGKRFGAEVLAIVKGCTDAEESVGGKPPWRERKEEYIRKIATKTAATRLVSASDKLHNARAILSDYHVIGEELWGRFTAGKEGTLWYYRELVKAFRAADGDGHMASLVGELDRTVGEFERLARARGPS